MAVACACFPGLCIDKRAQSLRAARDICLSLEELAASGEKVPLANVKAAITNLELVERWLSRRSDATDQIVSPNLWRAATRLDHPANPETQASFVKHFGELQPNEELEEEISCSVESHSFFHPGELYVSTARLCFCSETIFGMKTTFVISWSQVQRIRLSKQSDESSGQGQATQPAGLVLRITLKSVVTFDGKTRDSFVLLLHNHMAAARLHNSASVAALGIEFEEVAGEFDMAGVSVLEDALRRFEKKVRVWELQRRYTAFSSEWHAPFLPHDGSKQWRWTHLEGSYKRHPRLPASFTLSDANKDMSGKPPIESMKFLGRKRICRWTPEVSDATDENGWQYAVDFSTCDSWFSPELLGFSHVRRRRWNAAFDAENAAKDEVVAVPVPKKVVSIMDVEHLEGVAIHEVDVGEVSLQTLAAEFGADDWLAPGRLMAANMESLQLKAIKIGSWSEPEGPCQDKLKGRVRSGQFVAPVPRAPMCPSETKTKTTFHLAASDDEVVFEQITQALDVPYGDYFYLYVSDHFTVDADTGRTHMERSWALRWVKSTWVQSMVESKTPGQLVSDADRFQNVILNWTGPGHAA
mmetsp:Transcript_13141/g.24221  ORF Transcript_13141/g.24221 Transcript_13141/m.24221 type:complete len:583 (+) Transcript_13141:37-1785(+)